MGTVETEEPPTLVDQATTVVVELLKNRVTLSGVAVILVFLLGALLAPVLAPYDPYTQFDAPPGQFTPLPPLSHGSNGELFLLGTDPLGRDILSRLIFGTRPVLYIVVGTVGLSSLVGIPAGAIAAYYGGIVDEAIMRVMDVFISFPAVVMAIMILGLVGTDGVTVFGVTLPHLITIVIVIGIVWSPRFARVMRGAVLTEMQEEYIDALKVSGAPNGHILFNQILVNSIAPILVQATLSMSVAVIVGAALSFLGIGVQPPTASWGRMLATSRGYLISGEWWLAVLPGVVIMITALAFNLVGDGINDILSPRHEIDQDMEAR